MKLKFYFTTELQIYYKHKKYIIMFNWNYFCPLSLKYANKYTHCALAPNYEPLRKAKNFHSYYLIPFFTKLYGTPRLILKALHNGKCLPYTSWRRGARGAGRAASQAAR